MEAQLAHLPRLVVAHLSRDDRFLEHTRLYPDRYRYVCVYV